jgi:TolB-like protein
VADVFISYAREDEAIARRLAKAFQSDGLSVWWDADLPAHRAYSEIIERNLEEARAVVVLWSKTAAKSQWVRAEADFARNAGKLVQAQLDGRLPPLPFNQIQCADLKAWRRSHSHSGWTKLNGSVRTLVSGEEPPKIAPAQASLRERLRPIHWVIAAALALIVATGVFLYAFGMPGEQRRPVLAVLPFKTFDARDESLVAGMWEDTRHAIGRNPQLVVLGPNTAQELGEKGEAAARRAADYLLQASVRTAGDRIRVSADLVRTRDGEQIWSQDFDRKLDDVFALQSEIAREIEGRIRGRLAKKGGRNPEHIATSGEAYALYSEARAIIRRRDFDSYPVARDQLRQVLKMDPNFAPAWASLSQIGGGIGPPQIASKLELSSEKYARKAIELAPNLAAGHAALAMALLLTGPVARAEVERAVNLDPNDYEAWLWLGNMRNSQGDMKGALEAYRRAMAIEPLFWPAVLNTYGALKRAGDQKGIQELLEQQKRLGADHLATAIRIAQALDRKDLAGAANLGLAYLKSGETEGRAPIGASVWDTLLQLGFFEEAVRLSPAPDFAPLLWKNDPRGLDMMEAEHIDARTFFVLGPLTENAGRVYLLSGRGAKLADLYRSLNVSASEFQKLLADDEHFLYVAPLVALALRENGDSRQAAELLAIAELTGKQAQRSGGPLAAAQLARVYAAQGRRDEAISMLSAAISRNWLPIPPVLLVDLSVDPAFASIKHDPRFEVLRKQVLATIARERARVDVNLLPQGKTA